MIDITCQALPIDRLRTRHHRDDAASARVLAKLGFLPTGRTERVRSRGRGAEMETAVVALGLAAEGEVAMAA